MVRSLFFEKLIYKDVNAGDCSFRLPILYFREDSFVLFFTADEEKVRALLPVETLYPVVVSKGRAVIGIAAFNYIETTIGPYGELGVAVPVVHGKRPVPVWPLLREASFSGFGMFVLHLPVTTRIARDAGRLVWGYPKFVADMCFTVLPEYIECELSEGERHVLTMRVARKGFIKKDSRPLVTYSVKDGELIRTVIDQRAIYMFELFPDGAFLKLGDHPVAEELKGLGLSKKPFASRVYLYRPAILPEGEVVERAVGEYKGYAGEDREGKLQVKYTRL